VPLRWARLNLRITRSRAWAHTIEKQHTLEVVHRVWKARASNPSPSHFNCSPLTIHTAYDHMRGSCVGRTPRQAEATLRLPDPPLSFDISGLMKVIARWLAPLVTSITNKRERPLPAGQPGQYPVRRTGLNHVVDPGAGGYRQWSNRLSLATQHRIGKCVDWTPPCSVSSLLATCFLAHNTA